MLKRLKQDLLVQIYLLPSIEELNGADITYACATNEQRNLICDNILMMLSKSHKKLAMVQSKCGDDNVQCGDGQNIIWADPCLKLFNGCPIMVSTMTTKI
jgi:hypothetical protein